VEWWSVDESVKLNMDLKSKKFDPKFSKYDLCVTGKALLLLEHSPIYEVLLPRIWIYARTSPVQKEMILKRFKLAGYITLMAGDGTNDVGALKQSHIGIALLDGSQEDIEKMAMKMRERQRLSVLQKQEEMRKKWGLPADPRNGGKDPTVELQVGVFFLRGKV
jgi:cation-transporting ATPase 13A1